MISFINKKLSSMKIVSIKIQKSEFKLELAVPITDQRVNDQEKDNSQSFLDNILGIDLGEKKLVMHYLI